jgi:hypothetical protein
MTHVRTDAYTMGANMRILADWVEDVGNNVTANVGESLQEHLDWNRDHMNNSIIFTWSDTTTGLQKNLSINELHDLMERVREYETSLITMTQEFTDGKEAIEDRLASLEFFLDNESEPTETTIEAA